MPSAGRCSGQESGNGWAASAASPGGGVAGPAGAVSSGGPHPWALYGAAAQCPGQSQQQPGRLTHLTLGETPWCMGSPGCLLGPSHGPPLLCSLPGWSCGGFWLSLAVGMRAQPLFAGVTEGSVWRRAGPWARLLWPGAPWAAAQGYGLPTSSQCLTGFAAPLREIPVGWLDVCVASSVPRRPFTSPLHPSCSRPRHLLADRARLTLAETPNFPHLSARPPQGKRVPGGLPSPVCQASRDLSEEPVPGAPLYDPSPPRLVVTSWGRPGLDGAKQRVSRGRGCSDGGVSSRAMVGLHAEELCSPCAAQMEYVDMNKLSCGKKTRVEGGQLGGDEWTRHGSFVNKPTRGWLHPDDKVMGPGVSYLVRYMGCVEVLQSMRALDFNTRTQVTREAISLVCEAVPGAKGAVRRRKPCGRSLNSILGKSNLKFAGMPITLTISTSSLNLMASDCKQIIANHHMQSISFASGGDPDTAEYVAYVAKDPVNQRACHILECPEGLAQDVISTIGQAFELRFKQYLKNPPKLVTPHDRMAGFDGSAWDEEEEEPSDHQYYNDFPGKEPPLGGVVDMRLRDGASVAQTPNHLGATLPVGQMSSAEHEPRKQHPPAQGTDHGQLCHRLPRPPAGGRMAWHGAARTPSCPARRCQL
ncbi:rhodopsin kinase-like [Platysternon megacephalum]|uniref:Rhodopsin kinase-like n=1 Tax=Platysternon megacephalum TaxID=55544 RepID=A0A4D9DJZ0_9SAUR|nr:rhodopsin kinase-like [Platysternon megacephalum]